MLVVPEDHPLAADDRPLAVDDLSGLRLILPVPGTAVPRRARSTPRTAMAGMPPGSAPDSMISATTPTDA